MTRAITAFVLVATTAGLACSGASSGGDAPEELGASRQDEVERPPRAQREEPPPGYDAPARATSTSLEGAARSSVTSTASGGDGVRYVAGVFSGSVRLGGVELTSRGGDDVFVARVGPDGTVAWARGVGSSRDEGSPKVSFSDQRVKLVAMTDGAADCGSGPLNEWSSEAFVLCTFAVDGTPLEGASFPTGRR
ncbi:MAG: hypothetical protein KF764_34560 [Labilithrix sp.]|nr:hypothetical protein [Labilithrix sp.]